MLINSINNNITENYSISQTLEREFASVDFSKAQIESKNAGVRKSPDSRYAPDKNCWTLNDHEGFFKIDVNILKDPNKKYLLKFTHMDETYWWDNDAPNKVKIKINGEKAATLVPHDHYRTDTIDITPYLQDGENTIKLKKLGFSPLQIKNLAIIEVSV